MAPIKLGRFEDGKILPPDEPVVVEVGKQYEFRITDGVAELWEVDD